MSELTKQNDSIKISDEWIAALSQNLDYKKYAAFFQCVGRLNYIEKVWEVNPVKVEHVIPGVSSEITRKILTCCLRDEQDKMLSLYGDDSDSEEYQIIEPSTWYVKHFVVIEQVKEYHIYNPMPETMKELFEKVSANYKDIVFTKKVFETVTTREEAYKKYGFDKILRIFWGMNEFLLPFYKGELKGYSEAEIFKVFMARFKIEISPDTNKTMQMYGNQREVIIHNEKHKMCNHIKIPVQASRIYFKYIDGKIYIGHSGEHLRTASDR